MSATKTPEQLLNEANETIKSLNKRLEEPDPNQFRRDPGVSSYWGGSEEYVVVRKGDRRDITSHLPRDYKPFSVWKSAGEFYQDLIRNGANPEFRSKLKTAGGSLFKAVQGMSEGLGSDGGFTVLPEFNQEIRDRVFANSLLASTDSYTVGGNNMTFLRNAESSRVDGSRHGGLRAYWTGEGATVTATKPTLAEFTLKLNKLMVVVYLTQELIDDSGLALEQYINRKVSEEFNFKVGDAIINGAVGGPRGIIGHAATVSVAKETGQAATTILSENLWKMWARMYAPALSGAKWYINQDTYPQLLSLNASVGTGGQLMFVPPGGMSAAPYGSILGLPIEVTEFNPTLGTVGDIVLANLKMGYVSASKGNIASAQSAHVEFLTDQLALRFTMRVDGQPWENAPLTPYKGSNTQAHFVTLDTRS